MSCMMLAFMLFHIFLSFFVCIFSEFFRTFNCQMYWAMGTLRNFCIVELKGSRKEWTRCNHAGAQTKKGVETGSG